MRKTNLVLLSICFFSLILSCRTGHKKYVIREKKLVQVLTDIHLADGIALTAPYSPVSESIDSASLYDAVFAKHHVTRVMFDSTMAYYAHKPDKLQSVYSKVTALLNQMDADLKAGKIDAADNKKILIWQDSKVYALPQMGNDNKVAVSLPVKKPGFYTVSAKIKLFGDDQSVAPRMTLFFWYENDSPAGHREYFRNSPITKDGRTGTYTVTQKLANPKITHLKGYILDHSNTDSLFIKHAIVSDIKVYFKESN
ncbi:MAG: DUF4296 domain-containing protein [Bacteroidales bacterium]|nr:DUF4296 domain-containing protein [Bacteroidales bacterium]MBN2762399.1 DUF4296 domain-containing protein [Bacteroidales bacterium]